MGHLLGFEIWMRIHNKKGRETAFYNVILMKTHNEK
jgi:hypothetical protein